MNMLHCYFHKIGFYTFHFLKKNKDRKEKNKIENK